MKLSLVAFGCVLLGVVACAPQGKKLSSSSSSGSSSTGLMAVAEGPGGEGAADAPAADAPAVDATNAAEVTAAQQGKTVSVYNRGTVTVTLDAAQRDGYSWRLAEIPDPTVLKLVSQDFVPPAAGAGRGQQKLVFRAVGPGDVDVKMWYGNLRTAPMSSNPKFDFIASVTDAAGSVKNTKTESKPKKEKKPEIGQAF